MKQLTNRRGLLFRVAVSRSNYDEKRILETPSSTHGYRNF